MTWQQVVMWAAVLFVGLPAAWRNVTALALVVAWAVAEAAWLVTGDNLPLKIYFMADIAVLLVIYAKAAREHPGEWRGLFRNLTLCDRWIAGSLILVTWPLYVITLEPWLKWQLLWLIAIGQFLAAGTEAFHQKRKASQPLTEAEPSTGSGSLRFAAGGAGGWT